MAIPLCCDARAPRAELTSTYREFAAPSDLQAALRCTWEGAPGWARTMTVLPDGCCDVSWDGRSLRASPARPHAVRLRLEPSRPAACTVGVRLEPHVARRVLRATPRQLADGEVLEATGWDRVALRRLRAAASPADARAALVELVRRRLERPSSSAEGALARAVALLRDGAPVDAVAAELTMSVRTLRERFRAEVGLSPKAFQRTARLHRFLLAVGAPNGAVGAGPANLSGLAAELGYADQAHLTRECRALTGRTAADLARRVRLAPR